MHFETKVRTIQGIMYLYKSFVNKYRDAYVIKLHWPWQFHSNMVRWGCGDIRHLKQWDILSFFWLSEMDHDGTFGGSRYAIQSSAILTGWMYPKMQQEYWLYIRWLNACKHASGLGSSFWSSFTGDTLTFTTWSSGILSCFWFFVLTLSSWNVL